MTTVVRTHAQRFKKIAKRIPHAVRAQVLANAHETADFGLRAVQAVINKTKPVPAATGLYRNSWKVKKTSKGALLFNSAKHAKYVEFGRRPGKRPPLAAIEQWVRVKRLGSTAKERRAIAFAVQNKIGKKGIKPRRVMERTAKVMEKFYERNLGRMVAATKPPR